MPDDFNILRFDGLLAASLSCSVSLGLRTIPEKIWKDASFSYYPQLQRDHLSANALTTKNSNVTHFPISHDSIQLVPPSFLILLYLLLNRLTESLLILCVLHISLFFLYKPHHIKILANDPGKLPHTSNIMQFIPGSSLSRLPLGIYPLNTPIHSYQQICVEDNADAPFN